MPSGFDQQSVQNALDTARQDSSKLGVYLPAGEYQTSSKFQVYGKSIRVVGAGPWYTRFSTPSSQTETDAGFRADSTANGSTFADFAFFGNYTIRIDGPGKVFDLANVSHKVDALASGPMSLFDYIGGQFDRSVTWRRRSFRWRRQRWRQRTRITTDPTKLFVRPPGWRRS